ncbi:MAG: lamin tail domain-containing protein [Candidatus Pacebacteria bacterium]|nr:lamin tail domain-containing protein [Candidatus Paceibacterota bacterium]
MNRLLLASFILLLPTHLLFASVSISEVAWMGSVESTNHEWIELYNNGESVAVDGWTLTDGVGLNITLAGTIPGSTYVILERNRSDGGSVVGTPLLNYSGALVNTGATLTLSQADGSIVDSVAGGENWQNIGGDNTTKETAQYTTGGWITASPTPGRANATTGSVQTTSVTSSGSSSTNTSTSASTKTTTSKSTTSTKNFSLQIIAPNFIYAGQPVKFSATASGVDSTIHKSVHHRWNFGDLNTSSETKPTHTFTYPGTYNVVVNGEWNMNDASDQIELTVLPITVSLSHSIRGDVLLQNDAMYPVDVSGYQLTASKELQIPAYTLISRRGTLTIPWSMLGSSPFPPTFLKGREKEMITSTYVTKAVEEEDFVSTALVPTISSQPVAQSEPEAIVEEVVTSEPLSLPTPFGFTTAVAYADDGEGNVDTQSGLSEESEVLTKVGREAGDTTSVTPLLTTSATPENLPVTAWWTYILLTLVLGGAVATLVYKPSK